MKLEVGMYVRTKEGIRKIINLDVNYKDEIEAIHFDEYLLNANNSKILWPVMFYLIKNAKASFNIIDLIESGDYVNGELVESIDIDNNQVDIWNDSLYRIYSTNSTCKYKNIKTILTHEQYKENVYEIGE